MLRALTCKGLHFVRSEYLPKLLYRCIVKNGHVGSGRHVERTIVVRANSVLEAMNKAKRTPGVKKGRLMRNGGSVLSVERA